MRSIITVVVSLAVLAMATSAPGKPTGAQPHHGHCRTHACWHRVHVGRVNRLIRREIAAITPYGPCYGGKWAVPCNIIARESKGRWSALNTWTSGLACSRRACGPYQFLGWRVPWPVRTLRDQLQHHRMARKLWGQQTAGLSCAWCG